MLRTCFFLALLSTPLPRAIDVRKAPASPTRREDALHLAGAAAAADGLTPIRAVGSQAKPRGAPGGRTAAEPLAFAESVGTKVPEKPHGAAENPTDLRRDPEVPTKNKAVLVLFEIFGLGWLGIDRMYMSNPGFGLLKLVSCGGCGVVFVIDFGLVLINAISGSSSIGVFLFAANFEPDSVEPAKILGFLGLLPLLLMGVEFCCGFAKWQLVDPMEQALYILAERTRVWLPHWLGGPPEPVLVVRVEPPDGSPAYYAKVQNQFSVYDS